MKNWQTWCEEKVAYPGSSFALVRIFVEPELRDPLTAVRAMRREVESIMHKASDPAVAQAKFTWWMEEVQRARAGQPRHPATAGVGERFASIPMAELSGWFKALMEEADGASYPDRQALWARHRAVGGAGALLEAHALGLSTTVPEQVERVRQWGAALEAVRALRGLSSDRSHHVFLIPLSALARAGVKRQEIESAHGARVKTLLLDEVSRTLERLPAIESGQPGALRHLAIELALARRWLNQAVRKPARLTQRQLPAGPMAAWTAWRAARQSRSTRTNK